MNRSLLCLVATLVALCAVPAAALAADHTDAPAVLTDPAADLTDFYAWATDDGKLVAIMAFAGLGETGASGVYDADVLYGLHIDSDGDSVADTDVWVRFGQNGAGVWGVQVMNLPGESGPVVGPVGEDVTASGGGVVHAGVFDDPFFFDLGGFLETLDSGGIAFDSSSDSFAGFNVTAVVLSMDLGAASGNQDNIQLWATSARR